MTAAMLLVGPWTMVDDIYAILYRGIRYCLLCSHTVSQRRIQRQSSTAYMVP